MKNSMKLSLAIALALLLGVAGLSVWAAPMRQGTVPLLADIIPVTGDTPAVAGTFEVTLLGGCKANGLITRITDPKNDIGPAPTGLAYLTDGAKVELDGPCDIQICYPYPEEYETKEGAVYKWDADAKAWVKMEATVSGTPKQICLLDEATVGGVYSLSGK